jgi:hypothetical protein
MLLLIDFHRYNEELTQVFMSCNLMGGMFQRLGKGTLLQIKFIIFLFSCIGSSVAKPSSFTISGTLMNLQYFSGSRSRFLMNSFSVKIRGFY